MRLFVSIPVPKKLHVYLAALQDQFPELKKSNSFHVTLQFLGGDLDEEYLPEIKKELATVRSQKFSIKLLYPKPFGHPRNPRGIWVECAENDALQNLANQVRDAMDMCGLHADWPFKAHITLGRYRKAPQNLPKEVKWEPQTFRVNHFELVESRMTEDGRVHDVLKKYFLL